MKKITFQNTFTQLIKTTYCKIMEIYVTIFPSCKSFDNGYRIYVDIFTGENLLSIQLSNMDPIYWSVRSSSSDGGVRAKRGIVILASCEHHVIRVYENLEQHPSNNISLVLMHPCYCNPLTHIATFLLRICSTIFTLTGWQ